MRGILTLFLIFIPATLAALNFLPLTKVHWIFELNREFSFHYLILNIIAIFLTPLIVGRGSTVKKLNIILALIAVIITSVGNLIPFYYPFYDPIKIKEQSQGGESYSLLYGTYANSDKEDIWLFNTTFDRAPTFVAIRGLSATNQERLIARNVYPFYVSEAVDSENAIGLYSQLPLTIEKSIDPGEGVLIVSVAAESSSGLYLVFVDLPDEWSKDQIFQRKILLRRLASYFRQNKHNVIIFGNFSTTPFTWDYQQFQKQGDFTDAAYGFGYRSTTKEHGFLGWFGLDHVLYNGSIVTEALQRIKSTSKRVPLFLRFHVKDVSP